MSGSFAIDLTRFCQKADMDMKLVIRKITLEAFKRIILRTPVDTGMARGNWQVSAGAPVTVQISDGDKSGTATLSKSEAGVLSWQCQGSLFMVNNLPYIGKLEYGGYPNPPKVGTRIKGQKFGEIRSASGYSRQAPQGMVRLTLAEMEAWAQSAGNSKETITSIRSTS